jgi:hypothetical protein
MTTSVNLNASNGRRFSASFDVRDADHSAVSNRYTWIYA